MRLGLTNTIAARGTPVGGDGLALDLQFAADKAYAADGTVVSGTGQFNITSRKGPPAKFTRGSGATRVNELGLIEWAPENLILRSSQLSTSPWSSVRGATVTSGFNAPDGSSNGVEVSGPATAGTFQAAVPLFSGVTYTFSVFIKQGTSSLGRVSFFDGTNFFVSTFTWSTLIASGNGGGSLSYTSTTTNFGDGWYRVTFTFTSTSTTANADCSIGVNSNGTIYAWGAQLERATTARAYIPTTTAAAYAPRFDHDPVSPFACRGLLIEEGRTNLIANSNSFNNWALTNCTVAASSVVTPEGSANAWKIVEDSLTAVHFATTSFTPASGTTYTASAWLKSAENGFAFVGLTGGGFPATFISVNLSTGAVSTAVGTPIGGTSVSHSNGWWRVSFSLAATASLSSNIDIRTSRDGIWANRSYLGNGVNGMYCYGSQVEAGSFATSYIPTTTGTAARSADVCTIANTSSFWNSSEFTLLTNANWAAAGFDSYASNFSITAGFFGARRPNINVAVGIIRSSGVSVDISFGANGSFTTGSMRMALAHSTGQQAGSLNGATAIQQNSAFVPSSNPPFNIGYSGTGAYINGHIVAIRYYRKRLPNAKLQALTV